MYQLHRPDPAVPFEDSVGMLATLKQEGKIRHVGLSNVTIAHIETAQAIVEIASVQNRFSITERDNEAVLNYCTQHTIAFIPYGSLGAHPLKPGAPLAHAEGVLGAIATQHQVKPNQITLAWLLHYAPNIVLIPGTTAIAHLEENVAAASLKLSTDEMAQLNQA